jgi:hypothetical protein
MVRTQGRTCHGPVEIVCRYGGRIIIEDVPEQITSPLGLEITQKDDERNYNKRKSKQIKNGKIFRNEINSIKTNSFFQREKQKISAQIILGGKKMFEFPPKRKTGVAQHAML